VTADASGTAQGAQRHVLVVDDDALQLKLSRLRLQDAGYRVTTASSAAEALAHALAEPPDAIFSDVLMGETDGFGLCRRVREHATLAEVPVVLVSAHYADEKAHALAAHVGASILVGRTPEFDAELKALSSVFAGKRPETKAADAAIYEEHLRMNADQISRLLGEAKHAQQRYRALFESANDAIAVLNRAGIILETNQRWRQLLGVEPHSLVGQHLLELAAHGRESNGAELEVAIARGSGSVYGVAMRRSDGAAAYVDFSISALDVAGRLLVFAIGRDVTGRVLAAQELAAAEEKYRSLIERLPDVVMTASEGRCVFVTANVATITGFAPAEVYAMGLAGWLARVHPDERQAFLEQLQASRVPGPDRRLLDLEYRFRHKLGHWVWLWHRIIAVYERSTITYSDSLCSDVTQRRKLEEGLRQAQKMEAIGQLTGGIAHDFSNILATILANSEFLIDELGEQDPRRDDAKEIKLGAERAAALTRQLLAFSRRQVLELRITELNPVISNIERMLRRLIGEDIELTVRLSPDLGNVQVDQGQIEQVLLNLAVNARDAMPRGGKLLIETANVDLDGGYRATHPEASLEHYVVITVTDTGLGMDAETQRRIFEPFFTTKELGKGTGLGLATCHGIVSQSGGHIGVYSELGCGTVFKVYLPRVDEAPKAASKVLLASPDRGDELVLLVEDDLPLRAAVRRMLLACGYRVLVANDCFGAIELAKAHRDEVALLLADVVMPQMNGPELAEAVFEWAPRAKVLFMSGYTDHGAFNAGLIDDAVRFIQKPFSPYALGKKVREALDAPLC
jgi:PAS domain S-box-containing protein